MICIESLLHSRLVRQGPAKRKPEESDTDHWQGGTVYTSEFEDNDQELADYMRTTSDFIVTMAATGAFTVPCHTTKKQT